MEPSVPHHIQFGGVCSVPTLGISGGRKIGVTGRARTGGITPKRPLLHG